VKRPFIVTIVAIVIVVLAIGALVFVTQLKGISHTPMVDLVRGDGTVIRLDVEVADSPGEWEHGLMNRTSLPQDAGMIFNFGDDEPRYFWMENTLIPLDMIFIASNLTIIDIHENATPLSRDVIGSSGPCRYVLEVNGGLCATDDIDIGDRVTLDLD
jgi:uncharacterized membrane protein (UPF0127 family)